MNIFIHLIVGPCALEFTRVKTIDHLWTDPHADELVQRHRMQNSTRTTANQTTMMMNMSNSPKYRPSLQINVINIMKFFFYINNLFSGKTSCKFIR